MATLKVTVHEARDLPIMDRATGLADPYVVVKLDDMEHTTDIARRTRNPVWEHDVRFDTADLLVLQEDPLEVRVYDHDIISRDDIVGMVLLDCNSIIYRANPAVSGWFPLIDSDAGLHGDIRLTIRIKFHAAENPLAPALPERYVRRLDPRVAEPLPPTTTQTGNGNSNDVSISLSTMPSVVSNNAIGETSSTMPIQQHHHHQRASSAPLDHGAAVSGSQRTALQQSSSSGAAPAAVVKEFYAKTHHGSSSRSQSQQPTQSLMLPYFNPDASFAGLASGSINVATANSVNLGIANSSTAMNCIDGINAVPLPLPALLPFLVEQDLDPLQAARVDHPTLAAEEEGVFIFSVWRLDPAVFRVESTRSMMEELIVKSDPEHVRFTNLRSSRSINDARVIQLFKLSGKVRRQLARKVVELQCNAVLGYVEEFDMEPNGIIVRAYGTPCVVSQVKYVDEREMQNFLRGKTRYLQSNVAAAYQSELAQQMQMSPMSVSCSASPLLSGGGGGAFSTSASGSPGANSSPTYFPPPSTITARVSAATVTSPTPVATTTSLDSQVMSSSATRLQPPVTPPLSYTPNMHNNTTAASSVARSHLLPPPMTLLTNDSVTAAQMPPETTSTAIHSLATTPLHRPISDPVTHDGAPVVDVDSLAINDSCGRVVATPATVPADTTTAAVHRHHANAGVGASLGGVSSADAPVAAVAISANSSGTPTYVGETPDSAAAAVSQNPQLYASPMGSVRGSLAEAGVAATSCGGGIPPVVVTAPQPATAQFTPAVPVVVSAAAAAAANAETGGGAALTTPARVMISMLTVKDLPAGAIHHIGGYICARSVKIVSRVKSRQMISQERDAWWMELREELRANARAFHCNTVLGYEEETQYHEDVVLLSLYGTAVMLDVSVTALRAGPEYLFRWQRHRVATKRSCTLLHLYEGPRRKGGQQGLGLLAGEVGDLLLHHVCSICHNKPVPEVLLAACTLPVELSCEAPPRLVQVAVSKTKPNVKGVDLAMAVSQALPFIEFALHKQLLFNLRLQQMNACFALRVSIVVGPDAIIGTLTGSGCRLAGLPVPKLPRMTVVDPLIANKESVVKLRDVIASRRRRHYNDTRSSSSSSSRSSSSTSSSRSPASSESVSGKVITTQQSVLAKGPERSSSAVRTSSTDDVRTATSAAQQQSMTFPNPITPRPVSSSTSVSTSKQRKRQQQQQQQQQQQHESKHCRRGHRRRRHTHSSNKHSDNTRTSDGSAESPVLSRSASAGPQSKEAFSPSSLPTDPSSSSDVQRVKAKKHHRKHRHRRSRARRSNNASHDMAVLGGDNSLTGGHHNSSVAAARGSASAVASSSSSSSSSTRSTDSSSSSSRTSSSSSSSRSSASSNSWVPTESSESDEDVYAAADEWHASGSGVHTKTSDYVVKIDDVEEADMMLGMVDSTNFEDGVLLTLPYVPDSANAFDWQERIVMDRRYARASAPPFSSSGVSGGGVNNNSINGAAGGWNGGGRGSSSSNTFAGGTVRGDGRQGSLSGTGGDSGVTASNINAANPAAAAAGRTALTTRLLNEYCAEAKRAFVHRACRMAMRTHQPLRLRIVNLRMEMMFVPNSADLQLRLEGYLMVASSTGVRQLRALEDRAFRVCMHYTLESLSGLWQYHQQQQQQQLQSQTSHSNAGGGGAATNNGSSLAPASRPSGTPLMTVTNANSSGRVTPSLPWGPSTPVLSPVNNDAASNNLNSNSSPIPSFQQQQTSGTGVSIPHSNSLHSLTAIGAAAAAAGNKLSMNLLLPLVESGPAYLDSRRIFVTSNAPFSMPYVQDITLPPPRVWSGVATAFSEDTAAPPRHTSTYAEYRDSRGSRTASLVRRWHAFVRATGQSIKGLVDRATGGTGDRIDRRLQQQRQRMSSAADGNASTVPNGIGVSAAGGGGGGSFVNLANNNGSVDPSMGGLRDANYSFPAARLPQDMTQLLQLIPAVIFTPLDYVAGRSIVRYLGRLSQHFIREDYDTDTGDDLNIFFQRAEMEMMCMVQAVVRLMGGNALLKHRIVYHEICDSDGSGSAFLFATVTGDVVHVSDAEYWGPQPRDGPPKEHRSHHYSHRRHRRSKNKHHSNSNATQGEDNNEDSSSSGSEAGGSTPRHRGASRRRSSRRRRSRARRRHHRHRRSSSSSTSSNNCDTASRSRSSSTSGSNSNGSWTSMSHTVSSSTTASSDTPTPSCRSSVGPQQQSQHSTTKARVRSERRAATEDSRRSVKAAGVGEAARATDENERIEAAQLPK